MEMGIKREKRKDELGKGKEEKMERKREKLRESEKVKGKEKCSGIGERETEKRGGNYKREKEKRR